MNKLQRRKLTNIRRKEQKENRVRNAAYALAAASLLPDNPGPSFICKNTSTRILEYLAQPEIASSPALVQAAMAEIAERMLLKEKGNGKTV